MSSPDSMTKIVDLCGDPRIKILPIYGATECKQFIGVELPDHISADMDLHIVDILSSLQVLGEAIVNRWGSEQIRAQMLAAIAKRESTRVDTEGK